MICTYSLIYIYIYSIYTHILNYMFITHFTTTHPNLRYFFPIHHEPFLRYERCGMPTYERKPPATTWDAEGWMGFDESFAGKSRNHG